jgi:hypothetical protein
MWTERSAGRVGSPSGWTDRSSSRTGEVEEIPGFGFGVFRRGEGWSRGFLPSAASSYGD